MQKELSGNVGSNFNTELSTVNHVKATDLNQTNLTWIEIQIIFKGNIIKVSIKTQLFWFAKIKNLLIITKTFEKVHKLQTPSELKSLEALRVDSK